MTELTQYKSLMKTLITNLFSFSKIIKDRKSKGGKVTLGALITVGVIFMLLLTVQAINLTITFGNVGRVTDVFYMIIFLAQIIVLLFGGMAVMNYLFYSKDNSLLSSLPIPSRTVFMAKFSMAYLSELLFAAFILIPMLTASGITALVMGYGVAWHFFIVEIFAVILTPAVPLLVVSLLIIPLMYLSTFMKRRGLFKGILIGAVYVGGIGLYMCLVLFQGFMSGGEGEEANFVFEFIGSLKKFTIFNYPLAEALGNNKAALNTLIYTAGIIFIFAASVLLAVFFYRRILLIMSESDNYRKKSKKKSGETAEVSSVMRAFMQKEFRTLTGTPILLVSTLMGMLLTPIFVVLMSFTLRFDLSGEDVPFFLANDLIRVAFITYFGFLMSFSTNQIGTIGISREGKNIYMLKSLPISAKALIDSKLAFATAVSVITALIVGILMPIVSKITYASAIIGLPLTIILGGFSMNCMGLLNDMKKPNLNWNNVNELTKNNTRTLKPMLIGMGLGFFYLIFGIVLSLQTSVKGELLYFIYYAVCLVPVAIGAYVFYKRLHENPEKLLEEIE